MKREMKIVLEKGSKSSSRTLSARICTQKMSKEYGSRAERHAQETLRRGSKELAAKETDSQLEQSDTTDFINTGRTSREKLRNKEPKEQAFVGNSWPAYGIIALVALALSVTFYTFPFIHQLATPLQSQYLYSGLAMQHGLTPFNDFFGAGGSLFYLINWLGNASGSSILLYLFGLLAVFASGILTYRLVLQQTLKSSGALIVATFVMMIMVGLGRGGDVPTLFALPLAIWAVKFLEAYFHQDNKDEKFILFGFAAAAVFVISPMMSSFFVLSILALFLYNITHHRIGRGFYQVFAALFGLLIIGYSIAYYALNAQIIYTSIEQSVLIPFTHFGLDGNGLMTLAKSFVLLVALGLLAGMVQGFLQLKRAGKGTIWYFILLIGALLVTAAVILIRPFDSSNFLAVLPFILVFYGRGLNQESQNKQSLLATFLKKTWFTPILALVFVIALPITYALTNRSVFSEEQSVAKFIQEKTTSKDHVYAVSADKNINLLSKRTASIDNVPKSYPAKFTQSYDLNVSGIKDKYIVVEAGQKVSAHLSQLLQADYQVTSFNGKDFKIYQRK